MRKLSYFFMFLFFANSNAQNKQILFGFDEIPQNLMINPSAKTLQKFHVSVPMLSGFSANVGMSGFKLSDLLENDGLDVNAKLGVLLNNVDQNDYYSVNQQLEVFNGGFLLKNKKDYISFGFYEELDFILYHPKDIVTFLYEGNQDLERTFNLDHLNMKSELLGVYHIGINRKWNKKTTVGLRAKLYSSVYNTSAIHNSGVLSTYLTDNNIFANRLSDVDISIKTSGVLDANEKLIYLDKKSVIKRFLGSGNMGVGLDFGVNYKLNKQVDIKLSVRDFGFIKHSKNTKVYKLTGNYTFEGLELLFPDGNLIDYWENLEDDIDIDLEDTISEEGYTTMRSVKFNGSIGYKFGEYYNESCFDKLNNDYSSEVGFQLYSIFRPRQPQLAATIYYQRRFSKHLKSRVTYTVDDFSYSNVGFGFSTQIGMFNLYAVADNLFGFVNLANSQKQSFQMGMNFIIQ